MLEEQEPFSTRFVKGPQDIDFPNRLLHVQRSKTPSGWRSPTLNPTCLQVLEQLRDVAIKLGLVQPGYFVFPWHGRNKRHDPTRPMTSWRTAWRSVQSGGIAPRALPRWSSHRHYDAR
jgi:hypothetical protein